MTEPTPPLLTYRPTLWQRLKSWCHRKTGFSLLMVALVSLAFSQTLDQHSQQLLDRAFNRALITFGVAKALNGVISVAQGTEVAVQPAGVGINLTPGQILDPINDMIERFSWIMLASSTSLGLQKLLLNMSHWPVINWTLAGLSLLTLLIFIKATLLPRFIHGLIFKLTLLVMLLRFAVPVFTLGNEFIYQQFLVQEYSEAAQQLTNTSDQISQLSSNKQTLPEVKNQSVWESAKAFYRSTSEMLDISKRIEEYKQAAADTTRHTITLIVVFVFQTAILPLLFLSLVYWLGRIILRAKFSAE